MGLTQQRWTLAYGFGEKEFTRPAVMGVLNLTPDSFFDGGSLTSEQILFRRVEEMIAEGADIIDLGAESTRPGSKPVPEQEELARLESGFKAVREFSDRVLFSIDTVKPGVARAALEHGCAIVNNVSGRLDAFPVAEVAAEFGAAYVFMHAQGTPESMQVNPTYERVELEVFDYFQKGLEQLSRLSLGTIVLDPGIGFGKTLAHNLALITHLDLFREFNLPILIGASRKSMIGQLLDGAKPEDRLYGTIALHYEALRRGAHVLRVHDVKAAVDSVRVAMAFWENG